jgi:hypothetical protein
MLRNGLSYEWSHQYQCRPVSTEAAMFRPRGRPPRRPLRAPRSAVWGSTLRHSRRANPCRRPGSDRSPGSAIRRIGSKARHARTGFADRAGDGVGARSGHSVFMTIPFRARVMSGATTSRLRSTRWLHRAFAMVCAVVTGRMRRRETTSGSFRPSRRRLRWLAGFIDRRPRGGNVGPDAQERSPQPDNGRTQAADLSLGQFALVSLQDERAFERGDTPCQAYQSRVSHATSTAASATMKEHPSPLSLPIYTSLTDSTASGDNRTSQSLVGSVENDPLLHVGLSDCCCAK